MTAITPTSLVEFIAAHRRIHGNPPGLRECVEHFDAKLLNVLMCLWEAEAAGLLSRAALRIVKRRRATT